MYCVQYDPCNRLKSQVAYILPYKEFHNLNKQAYHAQQRNHLEICGILVVGSNRKVTLQFLKNHSRQPYSYKLKLRDIMAVQHYAAFYDQYILGTFHSHPIGKAIPGTGDLKNGFFNNVEMIYDVCANEARLWCVKKRLGRVVTKELPLIISSLPRSS